jgi:conjugative relaxase-like TrwC/TraI family protein
VLSIGKLSAGRDAAAYYLDRVADKRCPTDYYTGSGEAPGKWIGSGIERLGLAGSLDSDRSHELLRNLLAGIGPDGQQLTAPVLRTDGRSRVLTAEVVEVVQRSAAAVDVDVEEQLRAQRGAELVKAWHRAEAELDRAQRRPTWPAPSMKATTAAKLLRAFDLDPEALLPQASHPRRFRDRLARALRNKDERTDVRLPGLDLTLSAPKSVSVLYALADAQQPAPGSTSAQPERSRVAGAVQDAHRVAVAAAIDYLELSCTDALRGHHHGDGTDTYVATDGFVGAAFEHRSSRCGDPQLHTHVVVANLLHGADGKWSALNTREIYAHAKTAGYVYQAVLRGELTQTLGVEWDPVRNGQADMRGLPKPLLRLFSKRRVQIEEAMDRMGLDGAAGAQLATLNTRRLKPPTESELSLRQRWQAEASDAGHDITRAVRDTLNAADPSCVQTVATDLARVQGPAIEAVADALLAPEGLTHKRATFDRKDLLRGVCEYLPVGAPVTLNALRAVATRVLRDERVVPLLGDAPVKARRYST